MISYGGDDGYETDTDWWSDDPFSWSDEGDPFSMDDGVGPIPINSDPNVIGSTQPVGPIPVNYDSDVIGRDFDTPRPVIDLSNFPAGHGIINPNPVYGGAGNGGSGGFSWPTLIGGGLIGAGAANIFGGGGGGGTQGAPQNPTVNLGIPIPPPSGATVGLASPNEETPPTQVPIIPQSGGTTTPVTPPAQQPTNNTPQQPAPVTPTPAPVTPVDPLNRNYYAEGAQSINDLSRLAPNIFNLYQDQAAQYGQADLNRFGSVLGQYGSLNDQLSNVANRQTQTANTALRTGNLQDAQNLGAQTNALRQSLNPELYSGLTRLDQTAQQGIGRNEYQNQLGNIFGQGTSALGQDLGTMAREQLALGTSVSPMEARDAQQSAREGWGARGLINSTGAVAEEVLNRNQLGNQRLMQRQAFAQNAYGQEQSAGAQRNSLGLNLASLDYGRAQNNFGNQLTATNARLQTQFDPMSFGNSSNAGLNTNIFGQGSSFSSGAQGNAYVQNAYQPFNQYSNDVYNTNMNAANARVISAGNNAAALAGARDATNGQLANSFLQILGRYYGGQGGKSGWGS
jgi:hypothetical protein